MASRGGVQGTSLSVPAPSSGSTGGPGAGSDWFGPGQPMLPVAPPEVAGRVFDYPNTINMQQRPRGYEPVSFDILRALAQNYDILRTVIETRKDQMGALDWTISARDKKAKISPETQSRIDALVAAFREPYPGIEWNAWLRLILEDLFVLDAPALYPRKNRGGGLYGFRPIDGATIKRIVDDWGDTPLPPFAAYQQILKGMTAVNYTADDLIYRPRNPRTNKLYGFGPVEQIITIINIGIRRETWQLEFFTSGSLPDALIGTPNEWTPDQLRSFQDWFDARLQGNTSNRRGATFVPGEVANGYVATKETELFGKAEEWLARVICYAFSVSPQAFTMMMNRATAQVGQETAVEEGLEPIKRWVKSLLDFLLVKYLGVTDLEFDWVVKEDLDPKVQDEILTNDVKSALMTLNEARDAKGLEKSTDPEADVLMYFTATGGFVPLSFEAQLAQAKKKQDLLPPPVAPGTEPGAPPPKSGTPPKDGAPPKPGDKAPKDEPPAGKAHNHVHAQRWPTFTAKGELGANRPLARRAAVKMAKAIASAFTTTADDVAAQVEAVLKPLRKMIKVETGDGDHSDENAAAITNLPQGEEIDAQAIVDALDLSSLNVIIDAVEEGLYDVASDTAVKALAQVGVKTSNSLVDQVNTDAVEFSRTRAAELVGKRYTADGELIDNPNPKWAIDETTRAMIRDTITQGLADNIGTPAIADAIQESYAFSAERAGIVARTEVRNANEQTKLSSWREAADLGITIRKSWQVSNNEGTCDICEGNEADGAIELDEEFSSGDDAAPAHPNCFAAGTLVEGAFFAGAKSLYKGPMRQIVTRSGARLTVTRYHPILSARGYVTASMLEVGDYAVRYSPAVEGADVPPSVADENNGPAKVEQVVDAIRSAGSGRRVKPSAQDFHGDALFLEGEVEIVAVDGKLLDRAIAATNELAGEGVLVTADLEPPLLISDGASSEPLGRVDVATSSGLGLGDSCRPLGFGRLGRADQSCLAVRSDVSASLCEAATKNIAANPSLDGQRLLGFAADIAFDEIVDIIDFNASCQVFDLQTASGWLIADGLVVSNCECVIIPEVVKDSETQGDQADEDD